MDALSDGPQKLRRDVVVASTEYQGLPLNIKENKLEASTRPRIYDDSASHVNLTPKS